MRAAPIVAKESVINSNIKPIGFKTRVASSFRHDVFKSLSLKDRVLYLKFEHLTRDKLEDCLKNGCRILQLSCSYTEENCLCVEGEFGQLEKISFEQLKDLFSSRPNNLGDSIVGNQNQGENKLLDVLILATKNSLSLANFLTEIKIPHVITFEFSSNETDFRHKIYEDECIEKFCIYFYEEIVMQRSIFEAFESAKEKVLNYIGETYFEGNFGNNVKRRIGNGPILLSKDETHDEILFSESHFPLESGKIEDISSTRCPNNIKKNLFPFTGRKRDIFNVSKLLCQNKKFLNLYGCAGVGKTSFALELSHHLIYRGSFTHGVFFIPLKKLDFFSDYEIKDLLKETIGIDVQTGYANSFKGKKMLLIFDDFDIFYGKDVEFPRLLFKTLKECGIACILIRTLKISDDSEDLDKSNPELRSYDKQNFDDIKEILQEALDFTLMELNDDELASLLISFVDIHQQIVGISIEDIKENSIFQVAKGNPRFLLDKLREKKIKLKDLTLQIDSSYLEALQFEDFYLDILSASNSPNENIPYIPLNKFSSSIYYEPGKMMRTPSSLTDNKTTTGLNYNETRNRKNSLENSRSPFQNNTKNSQLNKMGESERSFWSGGALIREDDKKIIEHDDSDIEFSPMNARSMHGREFEQNSRRIRKKTSDDQLEEEKVFQDQSSRIRNNSKKVRIYYDSSPLKSNVVETKTFRSSGNLFFKRFEKQSQDGDNMSGDHLKFV